MSALVQSLVRPRLSEQTSMANEKKINCRYCAWALVRAAIKRGMTMEQWRRSGDGESNCSLVLTSIPIFIVTYIPTLTIAYFLLFLHYKRYTQAAVRVSKETPLQHCLHQLATSTVTKLRSELLQFGLPMPVRLTVFGYIGSIPFTTRHNPVPTFTTVNKRHKTSNTYTITVLNM